MDITFIFSTSSCQGLADKQTFLIWCLDLATHGAMEGDSCALRFHAGYQKKFIDKLKTKKKEPWSFMSVREIGGNLGKFR